MSRDRFKLPFMEFKAICNENGIYEKEEIGKRWENYQMYYEMIKFDRKSDAEVGVTSKTDQNIMNIEKY